jgi:hypothetical protein
LTRDLCSDVNEQTQEPKKSSPLHHTVRGGVTKARTGIRKPQKTSVRVIRNSANRIVYVKEELESGVTRQQMVSQGEINSRPFLDTILRMDAIIEEEASKGEEVAWM